MIQLNRKTDNIYKIRHKNITDCLYVRTRCERGGAVNPRNSLVYKYLPYVTKTTDSDNLVTLLINTNIERIPL